MAEAKIPGRKLERLARENITWIRTGISRPKHRIDARPLQHRHLRLYEPRTGGSGGRVVAASDFDFDVAEPALGKVGR